MSALFLLAQPVLGAPNNDFNLVNDVVRNKFVQAQRARNTIDQRQHVGPEGVLQLGVLVQVVQDHLGHSITLEHDHQTLTQSLITFVAHVRDPSNASFFDQVRNLQRKVVWVHLVGEFTHYQAGAVVDFLNLNHCSHRDRTATGAVRILNARAANDEPTGGKVWSLDALEHGFQELIT